MFGYVTVCEPELKVKDLKKIQGILLWTLPDIERRLWIYGADDIDV